MTLVLILILVPEPLTSSRSCKIHQSHINALSSISLIFLDRFTFKFTYMHTHALASESVASIESPFVLSKRSETSEAVGVSSLMIKVLSLFCLRNQIRRQ